MSLDAALYAHLLADTDVNALVAGRIRKNRAETDDALPYIVFQIISGQHLSDMKDPSGMVTRRVQVNSYQTTYELAWALSEHIRDALQGLSGTLGAGGDTLAVQNIELDGDGDIGIGPAGGSQRGSQRAPHGVRQDFIVWYTESIPVHA